MTSLEMVNFTLKKLETLPFSVERNNVILEIKAIRDELIVENIELLSSPVYLEERARDVVPTESILNSDTTQSEFTKYMTPLEIREAQERKDKRVKELLKELASYLANNEYYNQIICRVTTLNKFDKTKKEYNLEELEFIVDFVKKYGKITHWGNTGDHNSKHYEMEYLLGNQYYAIKFGETLEIVQTFYDIEKGNRGFYMREFYQ